MLNLLTESKPTLSRWPNPLGPCCQLVRLVQHQKQGLAGFCVQLGDPVLKRQDHCAFPLPRKVPQCLAKLPVEIGHADCRHSYVGRGVEGVWQLCGKTAQSHAFPQTWLGCEHRRPAPRQGRSAFRVLINLINASFDNMKVQQYQCYP